MLKCRLYPHENWATQSAEEDRVIWTKAPDHLLSGPFSMIVFVNNCFQVKKQNFNTILTLRLGFRVGLGSRLESAVNHEMIMWLKISSRHILKME